eukprot:3895116-Rhodomonas_salina.6
MIAELFTGLLVTVQTVLVFKDTDKDNASDFFQVGPMLAIAGVHFIDIQVLYVKMQLKHPGRFPFIGLKQALAHVCKEALGMPINKALTSHSSGISLSMGLTRLVHGTRGCYMPCWTARN